MSAPSRSLQDTVVVVTGAGGGIGGATARLALEAGAKVVAGDIREDAVRPLLDEFGADRLPARARTGEIILDHPLAESFGDHRAFVARAAKLARRRGKPSRERERVSGTMSWRTTPSTSTLVPGSQ